MKRSNAASCRMGDILNQPFFFTAIASQIFMRFPCPRWGRKRGPSGPVGRPGYEDRAEQRDEPQHIGPLRRVEAEICRWLPARQKNQQGSRERIEIASLESFDDRRA